MGILNGIIGTLTLASLFDGSLAELKECFSWTSLELSDAQANDFNSTDYQITGISTRTDKYMFFSIPRDKPNKVPCTLAYVNITTSLRECESPTSPQMSCYPSFAANQPDPSTCDNIIYVHRGLKVDRCRRLWVMDWGRVGPAVGPDYGQVCPPRIHVFDLKTHKKLRMFTLPPDVLAPAFCTPTPLYSDVSVDSGVTCDDAHFYMVDRIGLIVYSWKLNDAWRFQHPYFRPEPMEGIFDYGSIKVQKRNHGIYSIALSAKNSNGFKTLYFQPFASTRQFSVCTSLLQNKTACLENDYYYDFAHLGDRGRIGMSPFETISKKTGTLFFGAVSSNSTVCWNTEKPYDPSHFHTVAAGLEYPVHAIVDGNDVLCVLTNKMPQYEKGKLNYAEGVKNYVVSCGKVAGLIANTVCEPNGE